MEKRGNLKLGALFVKELLNKQYKLNYYQKIRAQSQAFYKWKMKYNQAKLKQRQKKHYQENLDKTCNDDNQKYSNRTDRNNDDTANMEGKANGKGKANLCSKLSINVKLEKQRKQKIMQARAIKLNMALRMLTTTINEKKMRLKNNTFSVIKEHTLDGLTCEFQFEKEFELLKANDQSEINQSSDIESNINDQDVVNILSHIGSEEDQRVVTEPNVSKDIIASEAIDNKPAKSVRSSYGIRNKRYSNDMNEIPNIDFDKDEYRNIEFNPKQPLSIDIAAVESDDENRNIIIYDSKSKPIDKNLSDIQDEYEEHEDGDSIKESNIQWVNASQKHPSPFGEYK